MVYGTGVYGSGIYGGDSTPPTPPTPHEVSCDICGEGWRVEATHLATGVVKAVLHPIEMSWDDPYSSPGSGTITVATRDPSAADIWPHTTGIYISRVFANGTRQGYFGGYVDKFSASSGGATQIGIKSIDGFLHHRLLANEDGGIAYATPGYVTPEDPGLGLSQTVIAKQLVDLAITGRGSIPLRPEAGISTQVRVRSWGAFEFKNIGDAIQELCNVINGVKYRTVHQFYESPGRWVTQILFTDEQNVDRGVTLRGDFEGWQYGLDTDAINQASRVYGVGTGEADAVMFSVAYDEDADVPEFQATVAWKDVSVPATLDEYTKGAVSDNRDPIATPSMTLVGLADVPPEILQAGDIVSPEIGYGVATFRNEKARVTSIAWRVGVDSPVVRTLTLLPIIRPALSVKTQTPAKEPLKEVLDPAQAADTPAITPIAPPTPPDLPSAVIDLSMWKLTLATGKSGKPDEIKQPKLATYQHSDWFDTVPGPAVKFRVPQDGVTTPNSKNTRTELREMKPGGSSNASWSSGTMEAELAFIELPPGKPHVVAMQIHDSEDDVTVLRLEGTDLWTTNGDNTHGKKIMSGYQLGTYIKVKVVASGGSIKWYLNGNEVASLSKKVSGGYFKAGAYQQAGNSGSGFGEVHFKSLTVSH